MTNKKNGKAVGNYGEEIAKNFLIKKGFKILETNYHYSKISEIDIIALKNNIIHFVEVKTRNQTNFGTPLEAIDYRKFNSIFKGAQGYLYNSKEKYDKFQIDAIGIILSKENKPDIQFIENISLQ